MDELIQEMKRLLASSFAFYLRAQGCHWNVEGPNFPQYHDLFGKIYAEVYGSVDTMAEQIRALGSFAPASLTRFIELSGLSEEVKIANSRSMLEQLATDNELILANIAAAYDLAEAAGAHGLSNFLADRQDAHRKHAWMISATLKSKP